MKTIRAFRYNKWLVKRSLLLSCFVILSSILFLYVTDKFIVTIFIVGIVLLVITVLKSKLNVIKILEDHFELKKNIFAPIKSIQNKRFVDYTIKGNKFVISYISYDDTVDTITISENSIEKNEFDDFLIFLITIKEENSIRVIHNQNMNTVLKEAI